MKKPKNKTPINLKDRTWWKLKYYTLVSEIPENVTSKTGENLRVWARKQVK